MSANVAAPVSPAKRRDMEGDWGVEEEKHRRGICESLKVLADLKNTRVVLDDPLWHNPLIIVGIVIDKSCQLQHLRMISGDFPLEWFVSGRGGPRSALTVVGSCRLGPHWLNWQTSKRRKGYIVRITIVLSSRAARV